MVHRICVGIFCSCSSVPVNTFRGLCFASGNNTAFGLPSLVMVTLLAACHQLQQS